MPTLPQRVSGGQDESNTVLASIQDEENNETNNQMDETCSSVEPRISQADIR